MNHVKRSYVLIGLLVAGAILFFTGSGAGFLFLLWPLACMGMMFFMMRGMGMGMGGTNRVAEHTHPDGVTHSHDDTLAGSGK